jgi:two-component system, sensor histidine kinase PdtaS
MALAVGQQITATKYLPCRYVELIPVTTCYLSDANQRVMSIATLQRQLAETGGGAVDLAPYRAQLCASLGASMIYDQSQLTITTRVDPVSVSSEISVSLGLVVTELVINALKHAFPDERHGHVIVDYTAQDDAWALAVSDDGVGMPQDPDQITAGLGTSIVQALATQMNSAITTVYAQPGTRVTLSHPGPRDGAAHTNFQSGD